MRHALKATALTLATLALIFGGPLGFSFIGGEIWSELNFFSSRGGYTNFEELVMRYFEGLIVLLLVLMAVVIALRAFVVTAENDDKDNTTQ